MVAKTGPPSCPAGAGTVVPSPHAPWARQHTHGTPPARSPRRSLGCRPAEIWSAKRRARWSEGPSCPWHGAVTSCGTRLQARRSACTLSRLRDTPRLLGGGV